MVTTLQYNKCRFKAKLQLIAFALSHFSEVENRVIKSRTDSVLVATGLVLGILKLSLQNENTLFYHGFQFSCEYIYVHV
jgi:hypothetical protein